jgi:hypothetical protein
VDYSKVGVVSRSEDTDLCIRMGKAVNNATVLFVPEAIVDHFVGIERARYKYFLIRCYMEGRGKIELGRLNDGLADLGNEKDYILRTVPNGVFRYARKGIQHNAAPLDGPGPGARRRLGVPVPDIENPGGTGTPLLEPFTKSRKRWRKLARPDRPSLCCQIRRPPYSPQWTRKPECSRLVSIVTVWSRVTFLRWYVVSHSSVRFVDLTMKFVVEHVLGRSW